MSQLTMLRLRCKLFGLADDVFHIDVKADNVVAQLKDAIKAMNENALREVDAADLQLFLAKRSGDNWLTEGETNALSSVDRLIPLTLQRLTLAEVGLSARDLEKGTVTDPVHVVVVFPLHEAPRARTLEQDEGSNMVSVRCMLLHTVGTRLFSVSIADDKTVEDLHVAIAKAKPNELGGIDPDRLQLFLAKKNDVWLTMREVNILRNVEGLRSLETFYFSPLRVAGLSRDDIKDEGGKTRPWKASIHVVVVIKRKLEVELDDGPTNKRSTFDMVLK